MPIFCRQLKIESSDGKKYNTECSDVEGLLRIIQSIPSPNAEPFKRWLAKVGQERLEEIENPELPPKRMREVFKGNNLRIYSPVRDYIFIELIRHIQTIVP